MKRKTVGLVSRSGKLRVERDRDANLIVRSNSIRRLNWSVE